MFRETVFECKPADVGSEYACVLAVTAVTTPIARLESVDLRYCKNYLLSFSLMHAGLPRGGII